MKQKIYLLLGRYGDIINLLPVLEYEYLQSNNKPYLMVSKDFIDVLEGISYVNPIEFDGDYTSHNFALRILNNQYKDYQIIDCSVYGINYSFKKKCNSFVRESWYKSGCPIAWGKLKLNFDIPDIDGEIKVIKDFQNIINEPYIITSFNSHSSPFPHKEFLLNELKKKIKDFHIVDISDYKANRIYDLIILLKRAKCLITVDTATLHLARAVPELPIISLVADIDFWYQTSQTPQEILRLSYSEIPNNLNLIIQAIKEGFNFKRPQIRLVYSSKTRTDDDVIKNNIAMDTWEEERKYFKNWNMYYINEDLPKVKDMINYIYEQAQDNDILMISNNDICFVPGITDWLLNKIRLYGSVYFHRNDFNDRRKNIISEGEVNDGKWYCGSDAFAFTKEWWGKNRDIFPDVYYARKMWDLVLRNLIKRTGGVEIHNAIYHFKHKSYWENEGKNCAENIHNTKVATEWLGKYGLRQGDAFNDWKYSQGKLLYK